jgi:hypothetical protein
LKLGYGRCFLQGKSPFCFGQCSAKYLLYFFQRNGKKAKLEKINDVGGGKKYWKEYRKPDGSIYENRKK